MMSSLHHNVVQYSQKKNQSNKEKYFSLKVSNICGFKQRHSRALHVVSVIQNRCQLIGRGSVCHYVGK